MPDQSDEIFILNGDSLEPMPFRTMREGLLGATLEGALQRFFEKYPELIPGKQIEPGAEEPPRFILLRREMPISSWSLDHLFVDQRGVLTLVETKLFENPQARREVIGQVIEYAANARDSWSNGEARQKATEYWNKSGKNLEDVLREGFGEELDMDGFWATVEENLNEGRIRLIIASDEMRSEMLRMIEYLNREMGNAEVLGLELKCYGKDQGLVVVVPRLFGQTQSTIDRKKAVRNVSTLWTPDILRRTYEGMPDAGLAQRLRKVLDWSVEKNLFVKGVSGNPSFGVQEKKGKRLVSFYQDGAIYLILNYSGDDQYMGGIEERKRFVDAFKNVNLLDQGLDPAQVVSGRNISRRLQELSDEELSWLLDTLSAYGG